MKISDTSALIEVIKEQNKTIEFIHKTIEEMSTNITILREEIGYLNGKLYETEATPDAEEDLILKKASKKAHLRKKELIIFQEKKSSIPCRLKIKSAQLMETGNFL